MRSQDEARFPIAPTLVQTLGVKGHRPTVGTWDNKDKVYAFASVNCITGKLTAPQVQSPTEQRRKRPRATPSRCSAPLPVTCATWGACIPPVAFPRS